MNTNGPTGAQTMEALAKAMAKHNGLDWNDLCAYDREMYRDEARKAGAANSVAEMCEQEGVSFEIRYS